MLWFCCAICAARGNGCVHQRDGSIFVVIVLVLFLMNVRTALITPRALPLSIMVTFLVFHFFGLSVNTMTLGGIAVAIGELVDDAVVDVENVFRRLRENRQAASPRPNLDVLYEASSEVRNPMLLGTIIMMLVFLPTLFLPGLEGQLFRPLAVVILGGLMTSTALDFFVTPTVFLKFGRRASERLAREHGTQFTEHQAAPEGSRTQGV